LGLLELAPQHGLPSASLRVYADNKGTLDIYLRGQRKIVSRMQEIFDSAILKSKLSEEDKDDRVYDLDPLLSKDFQFIYSPETGIEEIALKKMRFKLQGPGNRRISIEADPTNNPDAIYDLFEKQPNLFPCREPTSLRTS